MRRLLIVLFIGLFALMAGRQAMPARAATFTVTNTSDVNPGSLRQAIEQANATPGADTINITATGTLTLVSNLPPITDAVTIIGPGPSQFIINAACGGCSSGIRSIDANVTASGFAISGTFGDAIGLFRGTSTWDNIAVSNVSNGVGLRVNVGSTATLTNSVFSNFADNALGLFANHDVLIVRGSTFSSSPNAILQNGGTLTMENSVVTGTRELLTASQSVSNVTNTTFFGSNFNAIFTRFGGTANLTNVTISTTAVAILTQNFGTTNLLNTIVAGAIVTGTTGGSCARLGTVRSLGNNLSPDATCNLNAAGDKPNTPPGFATGALANNGGPTQTLALAPSSAAVDGGSNAAATCAAGTFDQRGPGFPRVLDGDSNGTATCDIGAFELTPSADVSVTKVSTSASVNAGATATFTITVRNNGPTIAGSIVVTDVLPTGLLFTSLTPATGPGFTSSHPAVGSGGTVRIDIASLAPNASQVFTLVTQVSASTTTTGIANTVTVSSATADPNPANNSSAAAVGAVASTPTPTPTVTPILPAAPTPFVPPVIPQVFQNPGAIAAVAGRPPATPRPAVALVAPIRTLPLVITPPRTGDAGLRDEFIER